VPSGRARDQCEHTGRSRSPRREKAFWNGARGPAGLACPGRAQSEGGSHAEGVAVGQEHEAVRGG
jgi:hypothetical protein